MGSYLFQVTYTSESWATQVSQQANVVDRITPLVDKCGGSITSCFYTLGDYDLIVLADFPTAEAAAAFSMGATAGGATKTIKTTELLSVDQGISAMRTAAEARTVYLPPLQDPVAAQRQQSVRT
ncbi:MAG TPA: GYD domain-containing protein [Frankiaceae bacterium]|nr:GYD domain-containing protein [Frankiaceae bacterium]